MRTFDSQQKRFIGTTAFVFFCLVFFAFFQESSALSPTLQAAIIGLIFLFILPLLYCRFVLREPLSALGFRSGGPGAWVSALTLTLAALGVEYLVWLNWNDFGSLYRLPAAVERNFFWFILYELLLVPAVVLVYETFFRGLIQSLWLSHIPRGAVAIQALFFYALFFLSTDFSWDALPLLLFAPVAGLIVFLTRSLWYSIVASWLFLVLTDIFILATR